MAKGGVVGYKNLASKGRNGDTMLAHINPKEAGLLKSMGGAGTINPKTGLREFYQIGNLLTTPPQAPLNTWDGRAIPNPQPRPEPFDRKFADIIQGGMGVTQISGYTLPTDDKKFADIPLVAKYDRAGKFSYFTLEPGKYLTPDPNQPNIQSVPRINALGEVEDWGIVDVNNQDDGGFGDFIGGLISDFGPMILAGLSANALAGFGGAAAAGAGGAGAALSPYAAQAAGAYGGSAAAAAAAGAGSLAGIQAASAAQNALTQAALSGTGLTFTGGEGLPTTPTTPDIPLGNADKAALYGAEGYGAAASPAEIAAAEAAASSASSLKDIAKGAKDILDASKEEKKENQPKDLSSAIGLLLGLLGERNPATRGERTYAEGGVVEPAKPIAPIAPTVTTAKASKAKATKAKVVEAAPITTAVASKDVTATGVSAPSTVTEDKIAADAAQAALAEYLTGVKAEEGVVSEEAQAEAATVVPTETDVGKEPAAQGTATFVKEPTARVLQEGEVVSGSTVDQQQVEETLAKTEAAQGVVTEDMTTQGQLNKLLTNFDAGNPPPWAASSMRAVTAQLASRGLGASSLAGQAVIQATLEAALPVAAADAKVFEQMGLQNLSNRQQTAMVLGEQRAKFLGQEFDQNFQTKVLNAARIADIADKNFTADVTIAIENARLTSSMDLQNLSNRQALILAKTAQVASLETTNLNNRQQVAVENARAFLTLDVKNLDNRQQTALFKAKEISDSIITDTAAANAARATNAANALDADKINAQLALSASQYNAAEKNKVAIFNKSAADELIKFNTQEANDRAEFNANLATQVNVANSKLLADVSMANTREKNAVAAINAKNATDLSAAKYAQESQKYRDQIETAWKTSENVLDRATEISKVTMTTNATKYAGDAAADASYYAALGSLSASLVSSSGGSKVVSSIVDVGSSLVSKGVEKGLKWLGLD
jgi:hypothetical protein